MNSSTVSKGSIISTVLAVVVFAFAGVVSAATTVVTPANVGASSWFFYNDETDVIDNDLGSFVAGPGTVPLGSGSVQISVTGSQRRNLATYQFAGTALSSITDLKFNTYNPSTGNPGSVNRSGYLQFNISFDGNDTWQKRLVYLPSQNGTITQNTWKEWDAINAGNALWSWSGFAGNGNKWPDDNTTEYRTWSDILANFPSAKIRDTDAFFGVRVGEPYADGYTENIDKITFGTNVFDFEQPSTTYVNATDPTCAGQNPCYATIQAATDAVAAGGTVMVAAGTYQEQVSISKDIHLVGSGIGSTVIQAPATMVDTGFGLNVVVVKGSGVQAEINGLTVAGPGPSACGSIGAGIFVGDGADANIHDNSITDIRDSSLSGCQNGQGIYVGRHSLSTSGTATISDNVITGYQKGGVVVSNAGSSATINHNMVTGVGATNQIAQNGIQISDGATGSITNNTVSGNECDYSSCGSDWYTQTQSAGIMAVDSAGSIEISGNSISDNDMGIYHQLASGSSLIQNNTLSNNRYFGVL
ncbi:MAG: right-handed parallel beta-helix repeat-containing protein, partial [Candidatus Paceibacterota bacterium]